MRRLLPSLALAIGLTACAVSLSGPRDIPISAVAIRAPAGVGADAVSALVSDTVTEVALVSAPADSAWFAGVAGATGLTLNGPADLGETRVGFLAIEEPVGDTTVVLSWDGGTLNVRDALYEVEEGRYLDLLAFRIEDAATARPAVTAFMEYMATDVMNSAAVLMAVAVPSAAVGDSVGRMLSPAYFDALRCEPGLTPRSEREGVRLFYGPEARVYCTSAAASDGAAGDVVRANLVLGRR